MSELSDYYFNDEPEIICGQEVSSILSFDINIDNFPSIVDRFFTKYYHRKTTIIDDQQLNEDHMILFHSNRICLICLSPKHIAFKKGIESVNFAIGNIDRTQNKVIGKSKKGAMNLQPSSSIAAITCKDGSEYKIISCITGKLLQVNEKLINEPQLLLSVDGGDGFVAICLPKLENCNLIKETLLTQEQYDKEN